MLYRRRERTTRQQRSCRVVEPPCLTSATLLFHDVQGLIFPPYQLPLGIKDAPFDEAESACTSADETCLFLPTELIFLPRLTVACIFTDEASGTNLDYIQE